MLIRFLVSLSFMTAFLIGCGGGEEPSGPAFCQRTVDCPAGQVCRSGMCTEPVDEPDASDTDADRCIDTDGDGYGPGCVPGPDCDESDPQQTGTEICDGLDNDCDGIPDNGVLSPCGDCNPACEIEAAGVGTEAPFDLDMMPNDGLTLDEDGALILDSTSVMNFHIWIANTGDGQVVKLDTRTYEELGRYYTGADPSRTSVNMNGDVYVGNRAAGSVTKVSGRGDSTCPDTNGDGRITTSAGGGDILPWGEDDCVLWRTELPDANRIRAVAAQDDILEDGTVRSYVWVGDYTLQKIWKLDGETGAVLVETDVPYGPYGFALDARGNLWVSTISARLGRIDTRRCVDTASCMVETCTGEAPAFPECAGSIKQIIPLPSSNYGITVDFMQRVWMGGGGAVKRYDPSAEPGLRIVSVPGTGAQGIGADAAGFIWAADQGGGRVWRLDAENPLMYTEIPAIAPRGIGIDSDGKVWGINRTNTSPTATVITPGATLDSFTVERAVGPILNSPYTYSDMTGLQLRLATNPFGWYRAIFEGCLDDTMRTTWDDVLWTGDVPEGTSLTLRARTSDSLDDLATLDWIVLGTSPPAVGSVNVRDALAAAMIEPGFYIEVEIRLETERSVSTELVTPRITSFGVEKVCPGAVG